MVSRWPAVSPSKSLSILYRATLTTMVNIGKGGIYPRLDDYVLTLFFKSLVVRMSLQTETPRSRETPLWLLLAPIYYIAFICCYRFYIDIGIASLVLLITLCFAFGLLCGCCGKRPVDRYDDDFGTRATGASCLMS